MRSSADSEGEYRELFLLLLGVWNQLRVQTVPELREPVPADVAFPRLRILGDDHAANRRGAFLPNQMGSCLSIEMSSFGITTSLHGAFDRSTSFGFCHFEVSPRMAACLILASRGSVRPMVIAVRSRVPKGLKITGMSGVL